MKIINLTPVAKGIATLGGAKAGHSRLSPSGSKRWMACPGSIVLESFIPDQPSVYSDEGTTCHEVSAKCLLSPKRINATHFIGQYITVSRSDEAERKVLFTEELADISQQYIDSIRTKAKHHQLWIETRVDFSSWVNVPDQSGTLDAAMLLPIDGDDMNLELNVDDLKGGRTPVRPEKNSQLMIYGLGFLSRLGAEYVAKAAHFELMDGRVVSSIRLSIHQPKLHPGPIEWVCKPIELMQFASLLRSKAASVENAAQHYGMIPIEQWNDTYLNPSPNEEECAFCNAKATCPVAREKVERDIGAAFDVIAEDGPAVMKPHAWLNGKDLADVMNAAGFIEDWLSAVRGEVERRLLRGDTDIPGWGLELGRKGNRKFQDEEAATKMMRESFRLKLEDVYNLTLKTPTQLEKLTKPTKVAEGVETPAVIGPRQWSRLSALITRSDAKPSVKRAEDIKNPYVVPVPTADAFAAVPESEDEDQLY